MLVLAGFYSVHQICGTVHVYGIDADTSQQFYYDRKEVLAYSNDVVPDQMLLLILRALNIEKIINMH